MAEVGQETVDFAALVGRAAEESYVSLKELVEKSKSSELLSDSEKKIMILKYIVKTQQRMLRLNVLAKWCQQVPLIQYCQQLASTLSSHDTCFTQAADSMFFMHEGLQQARAPIYDVPSAIEVLLTGTYQRLPKCIEDVGTKSTLNEDQQGPALKKLDTLVRSKLLEVSLPKELTEIKVSDGVVLLCVDGEFKVLVTLGYRGHLSMWRILHLELLVGERSGLVKVEESRRHALGDDLERRMAASEHPFMTLYSILHELCVALIMDTLIRQVQVLRQGRWKDAIRFELISDGNIGQGASAASTHGTQDGETDSAGLRTPGLKIIYWLDLDKSSGTSDAGAPPFLKIEPGPDLQIKCLHSTFVIDPLTGKEADFNLDRSCIDIEMLLLRAIGCNRYTRLLEIYKEVEKNGQINRTPGDVQLQFHLDDHETDCEKRDNAFDLQKHDGQEVLRVRAYGSSFFTLGINIRNGRFLLRSSKNIISSKALLECEEALNQGSITAAKAFINLRRNSIIHLFACIGRFLGLEVFEHGFTAAKLPKNISDDSNSLFIGFPECGSSYFLLMQLDKEFKPCPKLIEAQVDSSGKAEPFGDMSKVIRVKNLDISRMHMCEDELSLSLIDRKMLSIPNYVNVNEISEHGLPSNSSLGGSMLRSNLPISFSSIVDEVFELEKGSTGQSASSTSGLSSASPFGLGTMNHHSVKPTISSPNWEGAQTSQNAVSNFKSSMHSGSTNSLTTTLVKSQAVKKLTASKSDQDLAALRSPHSVGFGSYGIMDEDQLTVSGLPSARLLSPPQRIGPPVSVVSVKSNEPKSLPAGTVSGSFAVSGSNSWVASPISSTLDSAVLENSNQESIPHHDGTPRKRTVSDMLKSLPSLHCLELKDASNKRRKIKGVPHAQLPPTQSLISCDHPSKTEGHSFADFIAEANKGNASPSIYVSALLHIVRHCSLCIKHARLTSQMEALDIPYVEEVGLRSASSNLWFRLPFSRGDTWQYICLRLGRPGSLYWDVKIIDPHYKDLWELQKGSNTTPWGSGVRIANTSDVDSHIHYDSDGVVLSYNYVEADSMKKLVADIQRLSNARTFALGMRKLLGARTDEKLDESNASSDSKAPAGLKTVVEGSEKFSEQMRRAFRIEAVGLMSLWFSFGSGVLARFVVEWESGKEGCRMHVSPDQLWPHTKFLEDFINGGEVASLLDCIRLTAGPLHALAAATRPARAAPVSGVPGVTASINSTLKQTGYVPSQGLPSNSNTNAIQASSVPGGNPSVPTPSGSIGTHNTAAVLAAAAAAAAAAGRGGPGIVPSSLLPIDVSVVLRGPYWIRIIYRKNFAVDMRCFAGDQVWLQPATPPKVGPPIGGSLPCPQFRPFIMEHVAQELNGIDSNFPAAQQALGMSNSNNPNPSSAPQLPGTPGNRANLANTAAMSRTGNAIAALNRIGNALPGSSNLPVVNPLRRSPGSGVPAHVRGELNTAIIGLGDDGGYGGGWVPLVALKKVLRGILKYLGVLWLFAQLPDLLKEILGSILKDNEGALLNLDQEQPALRFFVGGYVFAVSVHRVQLLLQVLSVKRFHHSQQQQQNSATAQEELTQSEIGEICDYFSRRVASEPYDASRVASFITLLTLPISVLREFLKLIAWKKGLAQGQGADSAPAQKSRIELCLENHMGFNRDGISENSSVSKSNIHYDRVHNSVDFALTVVLDPAHIPHINAAGGAAWLPYCVSVRLRYSFGENPTVSFLGMEGSHGGRACWLRVDDWDKCKQRVARTVEVNGSSGGDTNQGRLRVVADSVQRTLHACLQGLRDGIGMT
ncbi:hypothetical protein Pfo_001877 [Paulownia fortunei]|nr:hypothetical protein Pfo_001877 [Paulownia fortunei]